MQTFSCVNIPVILAGQNTHRVSSDCSWILLATWCVTLGFLRCPFEVYNANRLEFIANTLHM